MIIEVSVHQTLQIQEYLLVHQKNVVWNIFKGKLKKWHCQTSNFLINNYFVTK